MDGLINHPTSSLPSLDLVCTTLGSPCGFKARLSSTMMPRGRRRSPQSRLQLPSRKQASDTTITTTTTTNFFLVPPSHNYNLRPMPHRNLATSTPVPTPTPTATFASLNATVTSMPRTPPRRPVPLLVTPTPQLLLSSAFTAARMSDQSSSSASASSMETDGESMDFDYRSNDDEEMDHVEFVSDMEVDDESMIDTLSDDDEEMDHVEFVSDMEVDDEAMIDTLSDDDEEMDHVEFVSDMEVDDEGMVDTLSDDDKEMDHVEFVSDMEVDDESMTDTAFQVGLNDVIVQMSLLTLSLSFSCIISNSQVRENFGSKLIESPCGRFLRRSMRRL